VCLDSSRRIVTVDGRPVDLTYKEFELLRLLMSNPGIVMTRDVIMQRVWDTNFEGESRTVDMHIKTLRQKLGDSADRIKTIRNVGYVME
jgi:two-component system alkaline phosphatase synthesis response regulator PhoP